MEPCARIYHEVQEQSEALNEGIYDVILHEFIEQVEDQFIFQECDTAASKVRGLQKQYVYTSNYVDLFFTLLMKYNYRMRHEIKDAMFSLGHLEDPNKNSELIRKLLNSPVIQDISFDGRSAFTISSEQYGDFVFELASYYFKKNKRMMEYMQNNPLPNRCHNHALAISCIFEDLYAITSICENYFRGYYYHSYSCNQDNNSVIDLCYNAVINKTSYYELFKPQEISTILNRDVKGEIQLVNQKTDTLYNWASLLKIALYKQYLKSIGYKGSLEDAPPIKVKK